MSSDVTIRRGFTLVELLVAGLITAFIAGAVGMSLKQLVDTKAGTKRRLEANFRADAALSALRRDLATVLRRDDLFYTHLLITERAVTTPLGYVDRDEILAFNNRLRPSRHVEFIGEGMEFETQYRIEADEFGPVLWRRRDPIPDEYLFGGGVAVPLVVGIVELSVEAYDGDQWHEDWDSDYDGLPLALRVTVTASGHRVGEDEFEAPLVTLRTVLPIDRVPLPAEELEPQELAADEGAEGAEGIVPDEAKSLQSESGGGGAAGGGTTGGSIGGGTGGGSGDGSGQSDPSTATEGQRRRGSGN